MNDGYIAAQQSYDRQEPDYSWIDEQEREEADNIAEMLCLLQKMAPRDLLALARGLVYEEYTAQWLAECFRSGANEEQRKRVLG